MQKARRRVLAVDKVPMALLLIYDTKNPHGNGPTFPEKFSRVWLVVPFANIIFQSFKSIFFDSASY